jgi:hypothetical protein
MDSPRFNNLVRDFTNITGDDFALLEKLSLQYPYSQLLHLLLARGAHDLRHKDEERILHQSAVYATDRQVLKSVMTAARKNGSGLIEQLETEPAPASVAVEPKERAVESGYPQNVAQALPKTNTAEVEVLQIDDPLSGDALRNDIYIQLEKLQKLKHDFEISFDEFLSARPAVSEPTVVEAGVEPLIEEIKASRKKIKTDNPKQKEQNDIIDQFINTKPAIPKPKAHVQANDLAEDSGVFSDNVVSETLVDILLKQGKKDKAVEVLKKLIWKFPQKKAYFAAQIDSLKS